MPEDLPGPQLPCCVAPPTAPRTRASLSREMHSLAECQQRLEKRRALLRPTACLTNEETEAQRGDVICPRSHSTEGGLETVRLALLPPVPPLTASPFAPQSWLEQAPKAHAHTPHPTPISQSTEVGRAEVQMRLEGRSCSQTVVSGNQSLSNSDGALGTRQTGRWTMDCRRPWS